MKGSSAMTGVLSSGWGRRSSCSRPSGWEMNRAAAWASSAQDWSTVRISRARSRAPRSASSSAWGRSPASIARWAPSSSESISEVRARGVANRSGSRLRYRLRTVSCSARIPARLLSVSGVTSLRALTVRGYPQHEHDHLDVGAHGRGTPPRPRAPPTMGRPVTDRTRHPLIPPREVDARQELPALELEVLERWRERDVFAESLRMREGAPQWVFYEGPPTANGPPGAHHVLSRVFKDIYPRFQTMRGHLVERKGGWDCHGLPVEIAVEQK